MSRLILTYDPAADQRIVALTTASLARISATNPMRPVIQGF